MELDVSVRPEASSRWHKLKFWPDDSAALPGGSVTEPSGSVTFLLLSLALNQRSQLATKLIRVLRVSGGRHRSVLHHAEVFDLLTEAGKPRPGPPQKDLRSSKHTNVPHFLFLLPRLERVQTSKPQQQRQPANCPGTTLARPPTSQTKNTASVAWEGRLLEAL